MGAAFPVLNALLSCLSIKSFSNRFHEFPKIRVIADVQFFVASEPGVNMDMFVLKLFWNCHFCEAGRSGKGSFNRKALI